MAHRAPEPTIRPTRWGRRTSAPASDTQNVGVVITQQALWDLSQRACCCYEPTVQLYYIQHGWKRHWKSDGKGDYNTVAMNTTDTDLSPQERGEGERLSHILPEDYERYFDRWVRFWPQKADPGFHVKYGYDSGFVLKKKKKDGRPLALFGDYLVQCVERHLDNDQWAEWQEFNGRPVPPAFKNSNFWLGLHAPRSTTVSCLDLDNKNLRDPKGKKRLLGFTRFSDNWPVRPVTFFPVDHLKDLKVVYDHFPGRLWCLSSESLGLHAWVRLARPISTVRIQRGAIARLQKLGLTAAEVHPMFGRCLRRPFGKDYHTITDQGLITGWWEQVDYFEKFTPALTPAFTTIAKALLDKVQQQWHDWRRQGEAKSRRTVPARVIAEHQHHLDEARAWVESGCPDAQIVPSAPVIQPVAVPERRDGTTLPTTTTTPSPRPSGTGDKCAYDKLRLRNGQWPKELERIVVNGLPAPKSFTVVAPELAIWLYWVELYDLPEDERRHRIVSLILKFVSERHNGYCGRLLNGQEGEVLRQIKDYVALTPNQSPESKEVFAGLRRKRQTGQYKKVINLAPLIEGRTDSYPSSSSRITSISVSTLDTPLPEELILMIKAKAGRNRVMPFATKLVNLLFQRNGGCRVSRDILQKLLGYTNPNQAIKYRDLLVEAGIITVGRFYDKYRYAKKHTLTEEAMRILCQRLPQKGEAV